MNLHAYRPSAALHSVRAAAVDVEGTPEDSALPNPAVGPRHSDVAVQLSMRLSREAMRIVAAADLATGRRALSARDLVESASGQAPDPLRLKSFRTSTNQSTPEEAR
jgi:hypothetical protein